MNPGRRRIWSSGSSREIGTRSAELVRLYQKKVFTLAFGFFRDREDALEIVQETFMRVYEKIGHYRAERSLQSWIYRVARNLCVDYYRKNAKKKKLEHGFDSVPERQLGCADTAVTDWESRRTAAAIDRSVAGCRGGKKRFFP